MIVLRWASIPSLRNANPYLSAKICRSRAVWREEGWERGGWIRAYCHVYIHGNLLSYQLKWRSQNTRTWAAPWRPRAASPSALSLLHAPPSSDRRGGTQSSRTARLGRCGERQSADRWPGRSRQCAVESQTSSADPQLACWGRRCQAWQQTLQIARKFVRKIRYMHVLAHWWRATCTCYMYLHVQCICMNTLQMLALLLAWFGESCAVYRFFCILDQLYIIPQSN